MGSAASTSAIRGGVRGLWQGAEPHDFPTIGGPDDRVDLVAVGKYRGAEKRQQVAECAHRTERAQATSEHDAIGMELIVPADDLLDAVDKHADEILWTSFERVGDGEVLSHAVWCRGKSEHYDRYRGREPPVSVTRPSRHRTHAAMGVR